VCVSFENVTGSTVLSVCVCVLFWCWAAALRGEHGLNWNEAGGNRNLRNELCPSTVIGKGGNVEGNFAPSECLHEWKSGIQVANFLFLCCMQQYTDV
jgi:hypothetical protein